MIKMLQLNLRKSRRAYDLMKQTAGERNVDVLILSEQCQKPDFAVWHQDKTGRVGIEICSSRVSIDKVAETDKGYI